MRQFLFLLLALTTTVSHAQQWHSISAHVDFIQQHEKLKYYDSNQVLIQGDECALLIDAPGEFSQTERFISKLDKQLKVPLCYLLVSHPHDDHLLGMALLQSHYPDAKLIVHQHLNDQFHLAHAQLNERLDGFAKSIALSEHRMNNLPEQEQLPWQQKIAAAKARLDKWQHLELQSPQLAINKKTTLDLGNYELNILPYAAHTDADLVVYIEQEALLAGADMVDIQPYPGDANFSQWLRAFDDLAALDITQVLPGHGDAYSKASLSIPKAWLIAIVEHVNKHPEQNVEELVASFPTHFSPSEPGLEQRAYRVFLTAGLQRVKATQGQ